MTEEIYLEAAYPVAYRAGDKNPPVTEIMLPVHIPVTTSSGEPVKIVAVPATHAVNALSQTEVEEAPICVG